MPTKLTLEQRLRAIERGDARDCHVRLEEHRDELMAPLAEAEAEAIVAGDARIRRFERAEDGIVGVVLVLALGGVVSSASWATWEESKSVWEMAGVLALAMAAAVLAWLRRDYRISGFLARVASRRRGWLKHYGR